MIHSVSITWHLKYAASHIKSSTLQYIACTPPPSISYRVENIHILLYILLFVISDSNLWILL